MILLPDDQPTLTFAFSLIVLYTVLLNDIAMLCLEDIKSGAITT